MEENSITNVFIIFQTTKNSSPKVACLLYGRRKTQRNHKEFLPPSSISFSQTPQGKSILEIYLIVFLVK
jgi:hypothetical protein